MNQAVFDFEVKMPPAFAGSDYIEGYDLERLTKQIRRVYTAMADGQWRTLREIENITGDGQASISAQLRHLRKDRFGGFTVDKRRRGEPVNGCWEYKIKEK